MIAKLESDAQAEASQKAYCDEEMAKTAAKKEELTTDIGKLATKIDFAASTSAKLKEEVAELSRELGNLVKTQAEMDAARADERAAFAAAKSDLEQGISGVQGALQALRDYYGGASALIQDVPFSFLQQPSKPTGHSAASGAGSSIIGMLEVIESDFSKSLTEATVAEDNAESTYQKQSNENAITKSMKEQDVKYKTAEAKRLDKETAEFTSDKAGLDTQLAAVLEYTGKLEAQCIAKPDTYEERTKRREAEIAGLKEALQILESDTALLQNKPGRKARFLRAH
jgi:chromosome segregation ATPase